MANYSAINKNELLIYTTAWKDLKGVMFHDKRQSEKVRYCMSALIIILK